MRVNTLLSRGYTRNDGKLLNNKRKPTIYRRFSHYDRRVVGLRTHFRRPFGRAAQVMILQNN